MPLKDLLDRLLPPFSEPAREKPRNMLFIAHERAPWPTALSTAFQHALVALMFTIYSVIAGQAIGLDGTALRDFVAIGIIIMGLGTLLNGLTTRVSGGHLLVQIPDPVHMGLFIAIVSSLGLGAWSGGLLLAGLLILLIGRFPRFLRTLFPPQVIGVMPVLVGMSLIPAGIQRSTGLEHGIGGSIHLHAVLIAAVTLATMVGLSVWSSGRLRTFALLIGTGAGFLIALASGDFGAASWAEIMTQPALSAPGAEYRPPLPSWTLAAVAPLLLLAVMDSVSNVGSGVIIDRMNRSDWHRPDMPTIGRMLHAQGLSRMLSGLAGVLGTGVSAANMGLAHATGIASRRVGVAAGLLLIACAFLPQLTTFIVLLPSAVVGAILLYTAAYLMVMGSELILSRLLDARRRATVGLSLVAGTAVFMVPELTSSVPQALDPLLGSGLMVGIVCAISLNQLFRIGLGREGSIQLDEDSAALQATRFLEEQGAVWGARRDVITRAGSTVTEAMEALSEAGVLEGPVQLRARFDELTLRLTLDYPGRAMELGSDIKPDAQRLMEMDDESAAFKAAMASVSATMIRALADRVDARSSPGRGELRLQFEH
jgi:xanthine/uracil permease